MELLQENIKNMGARIKQIDKKIEKRIKDATQMFLMKEQLSDQVFDNPLFDYRKAFTALLNHKLISFGSYLGLPNEEWAVKIMVNLLINMGVDENMNEHKRDEYIQAQTLYVKLAKGEDLNGADTEQQVQIIKNLLGINSTVEETKAE